MQLPQRWNANPTDVTLEDIISFFENLSEAQKNIIIKNLGLIKAKVLAANFIRLSFYQKGTEIRKQINDYLVEKKERMHNKELW